ncbi:type II toxin-antitoxin system PemK/MazF family toxin [Perlucidibaca aquatica]|uniref:type II toxin-antitoxin system PemK/MazF family toxin n=1 Tax=Perlucidibaca aquatica TaxID=1852776 RepID=UPI00083AC637|nr:type II toxin-antitoxin system PemK/MazF family toxin [Perlucidibaca aquatica]
MRGNLVTIVTSGDFGKPRPALILQADAFTALDSVTVLPLTSTVTHSPLFRIPLLPDARNGLKAASQIMVDKAVTVRRDKLGPAFGTVGADTLVAVERALLVFLGIAR